MVIQIIIGVLVMSSFLSAIYASATTVDVAETFTQEREMIAKHTNPTSWFVTVNAKPTERLVKLLQLDGLYDPNDSLQEIVKKTQKAWLQGIQGQNNKERTDFKDSAQQEKISQVVESLVQELGLYNAHTPALRKYKYGCCLGSFLDGIRGNLKELIDQWNEGVRFENLIFFTGERYLRNAAGKEDDIEKLINPANSPLRIKNGWKMPKGAAYKTEYDLCKLIWDQTELPEDMRIALEDKVTFVNAPAPEGKPRPGTKDCYNLWLKGSPDPGTMLAASHPLVWTYQQLAGQNILGDNYPLDISAKEVTPQMRQIYKERLVSLIQDTVAKCLYEISQQPQFNISK